MEDSLTYLIVLVVSMLMQGLLLFDEVLLLLCLQDV